MRLYMAAWILDDDDVDESSDDYAGSEQDSAHSEPEGWAEYALEMWGETPPEQEHWPNGHKPFFWPSTDRIYKSRSAAQRRVDIIRRWGGQAELLECAPEWQSVEAANQERERARGEARITKLEDAIEAEREKLAPSRTVRRAADVDEHLRALDN